MKPRDGSEARSLERRGLPWRMYLHGLSYRVHLPSGEKANLGRDLGEALRRYYALMARTPEDAAAKELSASYMVARHRKGARQRGIEFAITNADAQRLLDQQGNCCAITGAAFSARRVEGVRIRPYLPSIDRIENTLGYVPGNVRVVCAFVNIAMKSFGAHLFREVLSGIVSVTVRAEQQRLQMPTDEASIPTVGSRGMDRGNAPCTDTQQRRRRVL